MSLKETSGVCTQATVLIYILNLQELIIPLHFRPIQRVSVYVCYIPLTLFRSQN